MHACMLVVSPATGSKSGGASVQSQLLAEGTYVAGVSVRHGIVVRYRVRGTVGQRLSCSRHVGKLAA